MKKQKSVKAKNIVRKSIADFSNKEMQQLQTNTLLRIEKQIRRNNLLTFIAVAFVIVFTIVWCVHILTR